MTDYDQYDATELAHLVAKRKVSAAELLDAALARVEALNPALNAVNQQFYDRARAYIEQNPLHGPLAGVPFLLKDLGTAFEHSPTTFGSRLFVDNVPDHNSYLIDRYLAAGLVIFGKTATPEFGLTTSTESALWGATHNPWNLDYTAGGSSGGAAAAVAAGIIPAADGSDGGGSIRIPASCCGLVGLKPSRGRISMGPDKGEAWSGMSTGGALTRTVRDSALFFDVSAGYAPGDPYTAPALTESAVHAIKKQPHKLRIGWHSIPYNGAECDPECKQAAEDAAQFCAELGHEVDELVLDYDQKRLARAVRIIVAAQTRRTVDDRLAQLNRPLRNEDLEPVTRATYDSADRYSSADYVTAIDTLHDAGRNVARFFTTRDVLITPTMAAPPMKLGGPLRLDHPDSKAFGAALALTVGFTQLYNATGVPAISLPLTWSETGLPIGVQFAAAYGHDLLLLRLAAQVEEARPWSEKRPAMAAMA